MISCKKDQDVSNSRPENSQITVQEAKVWLQQSRPSLILGDNWNKALFLDAGNGRKILKVRVNEDLNGDTWILRDLMFQKNADGSIDESGYNVVVSANYFANRPGANEIGADKRDFISNSDFTGRILLYDINDLIIKGRQYRNGELEYELEKKPRPGKGKVMIRVAQNPDCRDISSKRYRPW